MNIFHHFSWENQVQDAYFGSVHNPVSFFQARVDILTWLKTYGPSCILQTVYIRENNWCRNIRSSRFLQKHRLAGNERPYGGV